MAGDKQSKNIERQCLGWIFGDGDRQVEEEVEDVCRMNKSREISRVPIVRMRGETTNASKRTNK